MSNDWDISRLRLIAGLPATPITESYDDDDEDPDVKRADNEAKKRGIKLPDVKSKIDPEKDLSTLAKHRATHEKKKEAEADSEEEKSAKTKAAEKAAAEKEAKERDSADDSDDDDDKPAKKEADKPAEKKAEAAAEAKKRGRAPNENSKSGQLRAWIAANPDKPRKEAWAHAQAMNPPFTAAGFNTIYQSIKSKMKKTATECFIMRHPTIPSFVLSENREFNRYDWISENDFEPMPVVFETKAEAEELATFLSDYKRTVVVIESVSLID